MRDVSELVARLRAFDGAIFETTACYNGARAEAADTLEAQAREIAALTARAEAAEESARQIEDNRDYWQAHAEEAVMKLAKAVEGEKDAISTLDAWFDRRKLAHDAIDKAVIDAASGYLRTSRVGGMEQEQSDLILGVIQDMAQLSMFADLFARAALAEIGGGNG